MNEINKNYNIDRNQQIYNDYIAGQSGNKVSYGDLAKTYGLSPQRIQSIVNDIEKKGLGETLGLDDPQEIREEFKKKAELLRENGNLNIARNLFEQIIAWDLKNENIAGAVDVYGHLRNTYSLMAKEQQDIQKKLDFLDKGEDYVRKALDLQYKYPEIIDEGRKAMLNIHLAGVLLEKIIINTSENRKSEIEEALELVDCSIVDLAGSQAAKAWPKRLKGELLFWLGKRKEAIETLLDAERDLFLGYKEEVKNNKENEFRIAVWLSGIHITLAGIAQMMDRPVLARLYATTVLTVEDPKGVLTERKKDAKRILAKLDIPLN